MRYSALYRIPRAGYARLSGTRAVSVSNFERAVSYFRKTLHSVLLSTHWWQQAQRPPSAPIESAGQERDDTSHPGLQAETSHGNLETRKQLARSIDEAEDPKAAIAGWKQVLALAPDDIEAHTRLAALYQAVGRKRKAVSHLQVAANNCMEAPLLRQLAQLVDKTSGGDEAAAIWEQVLAVAPDDIDAHKRLATWHQAAGRTREAVSHLRAAAASRCADVSLLKRLARLIDKSSDAEESIATWRQVLALVPDDVDAHNRLATLLQAAGRQEEAARHFEMVLTNAGSGGVNALRRLARQVDGEQAIAAWRAVSALRPENVEAHKRLAAMLLEAGRKEEAEPHFEVMLSNIDPGEVRTLKRLARLTGEEQAIAAWKTVLTFSPRDIEAHHEMAALLHGAGRKEPLPHFEAMLAAVKPTEVKPLRRVGRLIDGEQAIAAWRRVLVFCPGDMESHLRLAGLLQGSASQDSEAAAHLRMAFEAAQPNDAGASRRLAQLTEEAIGGEHAISCWRRVLSVAGPEETEAHVRLAALLLGAGRTDEAILHVQAVANRPEAVRGLRRLARSVDTSDSAQLALLVWTKVLTLVPQDMEANERVTALLLTLGRKDEAAQQFHASAEARLGVRTLTRQAQLIEEAVGGELAIACWRQVLAAAPQDIEIHRRLAFSLQAAGRNAEALPHFQAVAMSQPDDVKGLRRLARLIDGEKGGEEAIAAWQKVLAAAGPTDVESNARLASLFLTAGQMENAVPCLEVLIAANRRTDNTASQRIERRSRPENLLAQVLAQMNLEPNTDLEAHAALAKVLLALGRRSEAMRHLRILTEAAPTLNTWTTVTQLLSQSSTATADRGVASRWHLPDIMPRDLITAIELNLSHQFGSTAHIVSASIIPTKTPGRALWKVDATFEQAIERNGRERGRNLALMVKYARRPRTKIDAYLSNRGLPIPEFLGTVPALDGVASMWEFHAGRSPLLENCTGDELNRVVGAIAHIEAACLGVESSVPLPPAAARSDPALLEWISTNQSTGTSPARLASLAGVEEELVEQLNSFNTRVLTHTDLHGKNIIFTSEGDIRIIDWESASVGPPGSSLRRFSALGASIEKFAASAYVMHMKRQGFDLNLDEVLFVMRGQLALLVIHKGWRRQNLDRIIYGLDLAKSAVRSRAARSLRTAS